MGTNPHGTNAEIIAGSCPHMRLQLVAPGASRIADDALRLIEFVALGFAHLGLYAS